jgi:hypothetical protein
METREYNYEKDRVYSTDFNHTYYSSYGNKFTLAGKCNYRLYAVFRIHR